MTDATPAHLTNRDLFSNHYLTEHLPDTEEWETTDEDVLEDAFDEISDLYHRREDSFDRYNESMLERRFIRPVFDALGLAYGVEETVSGSRRRPDYGFFDGDDAVEDAFRVSDEGGDFYQHAVAVGDAKQWARPLDTQKDEGHTFENPSFQISVYLDETPAEWAILTNGRHWRIYNSRTASRLDSYYEVDLPALIDACDPDTDGGLEPFKYFYLFFRHEAFASDGQRCFLDRVLEESNIFAEELGEDLKDNIYDAIEVLAEGFLQYQGNDLDESDLDSIHDASLIYLYRLIFVLYAESEGRDLLDTNNTHYRERFSLNTLKQDVAEKRDDPAHEYPEWDDALWERLNDLFELIDAGSAAKGIPESDLYVPAYNGGLFRTEPGTDDPDEAHFLHENRVGDAHLAEVVDLLTRSETGRGPGKSFVDYSSLGIRHLGSIYEGLLEYQLNVADEPLAVSDGEYTPAADADDAVVDAGDVYLTTNSGERKATGSYYTPDYVVKYIVENTLDPHLDQIRDDLLSEHGQFAEQFAERVFDLQILDPAMGSGHFLTEVIDHLAREVIDAQQKQAEQMDEPDIDEAHDINWARRQIAQKCIYGVDLNPMAVELAKVSLWLRTLAAEQPLAFLDHHLKTGNSLVGSRIEDIDELESSEAEASGPNASLTEFGMTRRGTIEQLMDVYQDFIAIENQERADAKEMERKYREIEQDVIRNRLVAMANVRTADEFGVAVPEGAYRKMASRIDDDAKWADLADEQWFTDAQQLADRHDFHHWRLEFPEVFYDGDGDLRDNPGFDAVLGNPPYVRVQRIDNAVADYLFALYQTCSNKVDLSVPFLELGIDLIADDGVAGYISTSQWLATDYGEAARTYLADGRVRRMVDFGTLPVFEGISTYPAIFILDGAHRDTLEYAEVESEAQLSLDALNNLAVREFGYDRLGDDSWVLEGLDLRRALGDRDDTVELGEWGNFNIGAITGMDDVFVVSEETIEERDLETDLIYPHAHRGEEIAKYGAVDPGSKTIYPYESGTDGSAKLIPEDRLEAEYPNIHAYLSEHESDLRDRRDSRKYYADNPEWYQFLRPGRYDYIGVPKLLARGVATESCVGLLDEGTLFSGNNCPGFVPDDDIPVDVTYLLALLNSTPVSEYLLQICPAKMQGYIRLNAGDLNSIPVPEIAFDTPANERDAIREEGEQHYDAHVTGDAPIDALDDHARQCARDGNEDALHDLLVAIADDMIERVRERDAINLDLADYLGAYDDGHTLADLPAAQPAPGVSDTLLTATTETHDNLRLDNLTVVESDDTLTVAADVRYKPDEDASLGDDWEEPDRHGYVRSKEPVPAIEINDPDPELAALVRAFVPLVADADDGFADYYQQARKSISPLERIESLTLPAIDDVSDGLERYIDRKQRADILNEEIARTAGCIDRIAYALYDLDEDEVAAVEAADTTPGDDE